MRLILRCACSQSSSSRLITPAIKAPYNRRMLLVLCLLLALHAAAQTNPLSAELALDSVMPMASAVAPSTEGSTLTLSVVDENHLPLAQQAVIQLTNPLTHRVVWQTTQNESSASFSNLRGTHYEVEVSAEGYLPAYALLTLPGDAKKHPVEVTLQGVPANADRAGQQHPLPGKVRRNLSRGVEEIKNGRLNQAQKKLTAAYKDAPSSSEVNYLLGALYFQRKDFDNAERYLGAAVSLDRQNLQALVLLGRLYLQKENFESARVNLEQAVKVNPEDWIAHNLLAEAHLKQNQPEKAKEEASLAIEKGHGAARVAQLILAQAFAHLGQKSEAIQTLQAYAQSNSDRESAGEVQKIIAELDTPSSGAVSPLPSSDDLRALSGMDRLMAASAPPLVLETWRPAGVDDHKPLVTPGVACPAGQVIEGAGNRVKELVDGLARFDAIENMLHEDLDDFGLPKNKVSLKFDYVAAITEKKGGIFLVDEFRNWRSQAEDFPDHIATRGLPALAFVFHPEVRDNFEMVCEGLGTWNGAATWLVHFQQREDKPHHTQEYVVNGHVFPVSIKGRAWIAADSYQIVRLESDLVRPIPEIQLFSQHWTVDYGPVKFPRQNEELWLPKNAELYFDFLKHRYFRRHNFDHFMLFSVDTEEKRKEPQVEPDEETKHKPQNLGTILISANEPGFVP